MLVAGFLRGLTGFGFALVAVPILSVLVAPVVVVPMVIIHGVLTSVPLLVDARRHMQPLHIWPLMASAMVGVPFGAYLLKVLEADTLRLLIGCVATGFALLLLSGFRYTVKRERLAFIPVGLASGVLNGSSTLAGPPVILFFANQRVAPQTFRANILTFFFVTNLVTIVTFIVGGLFSRDAFVLAGVTLLPLVVGVVVGTVLSRRVDVRLFRGVALGAVLVSGVLAIADGAGLI